MAHPLNDLINRREEKKAINCNATCKYWEFPHLENACVLSAVFSIKKGKPCYEYQQRKED